MAERLTYTIKEAAEALGVSRDQVYRLLYAEELKSMKIGRRRLILRAAVREHLGLPADEPAAGDSDAGKQAAATFADGTYLVTVRRVQPGSLPDVT